MRPARYILCHAGMRTLNEWTTMRLRESVKSGSIDLFLAATDDDLEKELLPVRIPLEKAFLAIEYLLFTKTINIYLMAMKQLNQTGSDS